MSSCENPDHGVSVLDLNSDLQQAQMELLSASCAVHQLRLHYSSDDLARFGRREVLHKSAEAATALHRFYAAIENKIPQPAQVSSAPQPSPEQITQAIGWIADYLLEQREHYSPLATSLPNQWKA